MIEYVEAFVVEFGMSYREIGELTMNQTTHLVTLINKRREARSDG